MPAVRNTFLDNGKSDTARSPINCPVEIHWDWMVRWAFDKRSKYFDPKSSKDSPTWGLVDIEFVEKFPELVPLPELKENPALDGMMVIKRGMRLSVQPVERAHFEVVKKMGKKR